MVTKFDSSIVYAPAQPVLSGETKVLVKETGANIITVASTSATPRVVTAPNYTQIEINDFATKTELYDLVAKLTETVYEQELRIRELEEKIK